MESCQKREIFLSILMYCLKCNYSQACKSAIGPPRLFCGKSRSVLHNKNKYVRLMNIIKPYFKIIFITIIINIRFSD